MYFLQKLLYFLSILKLITFHCLIIFLSSNIIDFIFHIKRKRWKYNFKKTKKLFFTWHFHFFCRYSISSIHAVIEYKWYAPPGCYPCHLAPRGHFSQLLLTQSPPDTYLLCIPDTFHIHILRYNLHWKMQRKFKSTIYI